MATNFAQISKKIICVFLPRFFFYHQTLEIKQIARDARNPRTVVEFIELDCVRLCVYVLCGFVVKGNG